MVAVSKMMRSFFFLSLFALTGLTACTTMSQSASEIQQNGGHLKTIVPLDIAFVGKGSHLSPQMQTILRQETTVLHAHPDLQIKVIAYTDNRSDPKTARLVTLRRAMVVADYFRSHGISSRRISTLGAGSSDPIADNNTQAGRQKNRRVELILN